MNRRARAIAFYLPQYHPVEANDRFWGKGFTEWTNVTKAKPLYKGHAQPKLPSDLGFYDLRVPEVRKMQSDMALEHGIEAFCYWHYWFGEGVRVLDKIFDEVLASPEPAIPFCLGWANETWSGRWHGLDNEIIFEQKYPGKSDYKAHFMEILPALRDKRYFTVKDKPLFLVYKPHLLPNSTEFIDYWNELAVEHGLPGFFFVGVSSEGIEPSSMGFDRFLKDGIVGGLKPKASKIQKILNKQKPRLYDYESLVRLRLNEKLESYELPIVVPNWDNTPRSTNRGFVLEGNTPELYEKWLKGSVERIEEREFEERIVFVKSWNEWAEGNFLEPSRDMGNSLLEATKRAITK